MKKFNSFIIPSLFILLQKGMSFQFADEIEEGAFTFDEWLKMAEVSWDDLDDDSPELLVRSYEFSKRDASGGGSGKPITLDIFYESKCPYSRKFITNQVEPATLRLGNYVDVNFHPYGNAVVRTIDGNSEIHCQHGPSECTGNKIHACGLERLQTQEHRIGFVSCVMKTPDPNIGGKNCSEPYGLNWEEIESCSEGTEGDDLHSRYGEDTMSLDPPIKGVPTTAINKSIGGNDEQRRMKEDLFSVLCQKLKEMTVRAKECGFGTKSRFFKV